MEKIIADPTTIYHRKNTFFDIITTTKVNNGFVSEANKSQKSDRFIESHKKSQKSIKKCHWPLKVQNWPIRSKAGLSKSGRLSHLVHF